MPPETPQSSPDSFSKRTEVAPILSALVMDEATKKAVTEAVDAKFDAQKTATIKDSADARKELSASLVQGMDATETVREVSRVIQEELIEGEMKAGDLKTLTLNDLLDLEKDRPGILLFAFTTWGEAHKDVAIEKFALYTNPAPGTTMKIDFRGNREAYWKVGAGNLLPPTVDTIKVTNDRGETRVGQRRTEPKNGFYDANGYIPIFDGYKITIATPAEYTGPPPVTERPSGGVERRVDTFDPTGQHRRQAHKRAAEWRGAGGERVHPREIQLRRAIPETWIGAGQDASEFYKAKLNVAVDPAVVFAIIKHESAFNPGTPNRAGESSALGLGQFIKGTWEGFLAANPEVVASVTGTPLASLSTAEQLNLRTHPLLSIYAVTWLAADNAQKLGLTTVTADNAADLYSAHHDGIDGVRRYRHYRAMRATKSEAQAASEAKLHGWQRSRPLRDTSGHVLKDERGRILYQDGAPFADENAGAVARLSRTVASLSKTYRTQLDKPAPKPKPSPQPPVEDLDRLAKNPTLEGRSLLIGSSSTTGYAPKIKGGTIETEAEKGRSIVKMLEWLKKMNLKHLCSFDRIVIQGGVKNTDHDADNIDTSLKTIDAMVDYLRTHAPNVKIYVMEVSPWKAKYDDKIQAFNAHLNTPEFKARVAGVVPIYSTMDDGRGQLRPAFGIAGDLHVAPHAYGRYAGVMADWITRKEKETVATSPS